MKSFILPKIPLNKVNLISHVDYPTKFLFPLNQGMSHETPNIVYQGNKVSTGDILARGNSQESLTYHSSIGGTVTQIKKFLYPGTVNPVKSIEINVGGDFKSFSKVTNENLENLDRIKLKKIIKNAGIYDLDIGSVNNYLNQKKNPGITHICINAIEFSPLLILEEKILQLHSKEIAYVANVLLNLYTENGRPYRVIACTNYYSNYRNLKTNIRQTNKSKISFTHHKFDFFNSDSEIPPSISHNHQLICDSLSKIILKHNINQKEPSQEIQNFDIQDSTLILRPSTLLAMYEAIVFDKPFIDTYIQIVTDHKNIIIRKVPFGIPLYNLISSFNKEWREIPQHCFMDCFIDRKIIMNIAIPIIKNHRLFWFLTDMGFTIIHKKLKHWNINNY